MKRERELLKGPAPIALLEILSRGAAFGGQLSQTLASVGDEILPMGHGSLYPLLYNLEAKGLLKGKWHQAHDGPRRRYYLITPAGRELLAHHQT